MFGIALGKRSRNQGNFYEQVRENLEALSTKNYKHIAEAISVKSLHQECTNSRKKRPEFLHP